MPCACIDAMAALVSIMILGLCCVPRLSGIPKRKRSQWLPLGNQAFWKMGNHSKSKQSGAGGVHVAADVMR